MVRSDFLVTWSRLKVLQIEVDRGITFNLMFVVKAYVWGNMNLRLHNPKKKDACKHLEYMAVVEKEWRHMETADNRFFSDFSASC